MQLLCRGPDRVLHVAVAQRGLHHRPGPRVADHGHAPQVPGIIPGSPRVPRQWGRALEVSGQALHCHDGECFGSISVYLEGVVE